MIGLYVFGAGILAPLLILAGVLKYNDIRDKSIIKKANEVSKRWRESH